MSTVRNGAIRREWRWGGSRSGARQSATFEDEELAAEGMQLVKDANYKITRDELYRLMTGEVVVPTQQAPSAIPKLSDIEFLNDFMHKSNVRRASSTKTAYWTHLNLEIIPWFGKLRLDQITHKHVAEFMLHLDRVKRTSATVTRYHATLHALLEYAIDLNYIQRNPARPGAIGFKRDGIREFDISDTAMERRVYLTYSEFDLIADHARPHARPLMELLAGSGLRISEAVALDIQDINWAQGSIRVLKQVTDVDDGENADGTSMPMPGVPGYAATKGRNRRTLKLEDSVLKHLADAVGGRGPGIRPGDAPIFRSINGARWDYDNWLDRDWYQAVAAAMRCVDHLPAAPPKPKSGPTRKWRVDEVSTCSCQNRLHRRPTPHQLRHTHASWLFLEGYSMEHVSKRLGHSSVQVTDREYSHFMSETDSLMVDSLGAARERARKSRSR